jgi:hypothetical protein
MEVIKPIVGNLGTSVVVSRTEEPGVYHIQVNDEVISEFPVNPNTTESNISTLSAEDAVGLFKVNKPRIVRSDTISDDDLDKAIFVSQKGYEIWKPLIWLVLFLVLLETWLTRTPQPRMADESV